jgi:hypothetical protein
MENAYKAVVRRKKAEGTGGRTGHFGKDYNKIYVEVAA